MTSSLRCAVFINCTQHMYAIRVKEVRFFKIYFANLFDIRLLNSRRNFTLFLARTLFFELRS